MHRSDSCNLLQHAFRLPRALKGLKKRSLPGGSCFLPMGRWTAGAAVAACVLAGCRGGPLEAERLHAWVTASWTSGRGVVSNNELPAAGAVAVEFVPAPKPLAKELFDADRPAMPERIRTVLYRDWERRDPGATEAIRRIRSKPAFVEFPHARDTFANHLESTYAILQAWDQPPRVCRTGLVHTAYSGDLFSFFAFDAALSSERSRLAALIGEEAEPLVHLFGTVARHEFVGLGRMMANRTIDAEDLAGPVLARSRLGPDVELDATVVAELIVITLADYLDQTLEVNGWRDHHMVDPLDTPLFPGAGRPEVCLFWMAAACRAVKDFLEVVPPIFDSCTATLTSRDEERARDLYWAVVQNRTELSDAQAGAMLTEAAALNPHIGEVDALAAQLHFRNQRFRKAKRLAASALRKLYAMGATWDKRLSYEAWVGFCRLLVVRSEAGGGLPRAPGAHNVNDLGARLVPIDMAVELMP
ncbi:unnamed protein product [Pelagomonas calceolata]|uniref:DUF6817 domain-containing protein n=1 Tax=Pelagomonas calceolata TaxID=35677 RepID=A0A7S4A8G5_9STRA|nr:unnamed protein product [Pelagomonas calceolata]|mmetsp:Transcript_25461/g.71552  ORF Transcript_25461/g.71552 Transcript_25461/m.71552 type:complete len:473 (-) Transcript_25461:171-1589(-)